MFGEPCHGIGYAVVQFHGHGGLPAIVREPDGLAFLDPQSPGLAGIDVQPAFAFDFHQSLRAPTVLSGMVQGLDQSQRHRPLRRSGRRIQRVALIDVLLEPARHVLRDRFFVDFRRCGSRAQQAIPRNHSADFLEDLLDLIVFDGLFHQHRQGRKHFPIGPALSQRLGRLPDGLDVAFRIGKRAVLFHGRTRGKHHVRPLRGFRQKQVLAYQKFQRIQRPGHAGVTRQRFDRVIPHDE